jgi:hypothetical protein
MHVGGIFCDLAKAFDCVNHIILLTKLLFGGAFMEQRQVGSDTTKQKKNEMKLSNSNQKYLLKLGNIKARVLQGLILGPLLS